MDEQTEKDITEIVALYRKMKDKTDAFGESIFLAIYAGIFFLISWVLFQIGDLIFKLKILPDYIVALIIFIAILIVALILVKHHSKSGAHRRF